MNISYNSFSEKYGGQESTMAQLNSSIVIWFIGISQIPGNDLEGHRLFPVELLSIN